MAKILILTKVLFIWIYNAFAGMLIGGTMQASFSSFDKLTLSVILTLVTFSAAMIFLPELMWLSSGKL